MNILIHKARVVLITLGKTLPFIICLLVLVSYAETAFSLATNDFVVYGGVLVPRKTISWLIGGYFEYNLQTLVVLCIISIAIETCIYNKLCCAYLGINLYEKYYFANVFISEELCYAVIVANIVVSGYLVYKGIKVLMK